MTKWALSTVRNRSVGRVRNRSLRSRRALRILLTYLAATDSGGMEFAFPELGDLLAEFNAPFAIRWVAKIERTCLKALRLGKDAGRLTRRDRRRIARRLVRIEQEISSGRGGRLALSQPALRKAVLVLTLIDALAPSVASAESIDPFAGVQMVDSDTLDSMRGGFMSAGVDISFGVEVHTVVNGVEVLQTNFNLGNDGKFSSQSSGLALTTDAPIPSTPTVKVNVVGATGPIAADPISTIGPVASIPAVTSITTDSSAANTSTSVTISGAGGSVGSGAPIPPTTPTPPTSGNNADATTQGIVVTTPTGQTSALSTVDSQQVSNVVMGNASGVSVSQSTQVNIAINNFYSLQNGMMLSQTGSNIANSLRSALTISLPH